MLNLILSDERVYYTDQFCHGRYQKHQPYAEVNREKDFLFFHCFLVCAVLAKVGHKNDGAAQYLYRENDQEPI